MSMRRVFATLILLPGLVPSPAIAASTTVILNVENMYCASCPYIVKQTLSAMPGVTSVEISFEDKTATVTFDDTKVDVNTLTNATTDAGYPSAPKS